MIPQLISSIVPSWLTKAAIFFVAYFTPIHEMVHVMLIFLACDTISGIWASMKEGHKCESHKLRKTVYKFIWYTAAIMISWMMETTFGLSWSNLASLVAGFICFVELKSIFENITRIVDEPLFKRIVKILKKRSTDTIHEINDAIEKDEEDGKH